MVGVSYIHQKIQEKIMLPTPYVYLHRDPETHEVRYVGAGSGGRAWTCDSHRSPEHRRWLTLQFNFGYTMGDIVEVVAQGLCTSDARAMEIELVQEQDPAHLFNIQTIPSLLALSEDNFRLAQKFHAEGVSYAKIGVTLGVSTMTVYRALNNQTRGYQINEFATSD